MQQNAAEGIVAITELEHIEPDIDAVASVFGITPWLTDPEQAWEYAVSGDTAARMAGYNSPHEQHWSLTAVVLEKAAAYGWWPKRTRDGDYIAVPLGQWIAEGHTFTRVVPSVEAMLDRWNIEPRVIDAPAARRQLDRHDDVDDDGCVEGTGA